MVACSVPTSNISISDKARTRCKFSLKTPSSTYNTDCKLPETTRDRGGTRPRIPSAWPYTSTADDATAPCQIRARPEPLYFACLAIIHCAPPLCQRCINAGQTYARPNGMQPASHRLCVQRGGGMVCLLAA